MLTIVAMMICAQFEGLTCINGQCSVSSMGMMATPRRIARSVPMVQSAPVYQSVPSYQSMPMQSYAQPMTSGGCYSEAPMTQSYSMPSYQSVPIQTYGAPMASQGSSCYAESPAMQSYAVPRSAFVSSYGTGRSYLTAAPARVVGTVDDVAIVRELEPGVIRRSGRFLFGERRY